MARALLLVGLLLLALAAGPLARAQAHGPTFTLKALAPPSRVPYFVFGARPGGTVRGAVRVENKGDRSGTVRLYAADAVTGQTTGAVYRSRRSSRHDVGAWLSLSDRQLRLAPSQKRIVRFEVKVPAGAKPGQHLGGIVAENAALKKAAAKKTARGAFRVDIRDLSILAVQVNVPGTKLEKLSLAGVEPGSAEGFQTLLIGMRNEGNQLLKGSGSILVRGEDGQLLKRAKFNVDTFVPHTDIAYPFPVPGQALPAGRYHALVQVRYGDGHRARSSAWFTISDEQIKQVFGSDSGGPPAGGSSSSALPLILAILAAVLLGFLVAWALLRRRARRAPSAAAPPHYFVTEIHLDGGSGPEHVARLRWQDPATGNVGESSHEAMVSWIRAGGDLRVRTDTGLTVRVGVADGEPPSIRTYSDGAWTDDLMALPRY